MANKFSAYMRQDGRYTIIPEEPGRRDWDFYTGKFSSNMYPVNSNPLKKGCDKKESRELKCPI